MRLPQHSDKFDRTLYIYFNFLFGEMATKISKNCLATMYQDIQKNYIPDPILQILGFEEAQYDPKSEIIIRLSDSITFVDCTLLGSYCIQDGKILSKENNRLPLQFKIFDIVKLEDCFSKIDTRKMCKLRIIIRKMQLVEPFQHKVSYPAELSQFMLNNSENNFQHNGYLNKNVPQSYFREDKELIKIEEQQLQKGIQKRQEGFERKNQNDPLTYRQILQKKQGFFIGRLLRIKLVSKDTKQGIMSVLYLGFIDRVGEMVRINMAGRTAIKQSKQLKKNKCYYIKGLQVFQTQKMQHPQIRMKDKQSKILEVQQQKVTQQFSTSYYHWDHENDSVDNENVDVIGIIDEIQEKTSYTQSNSQDNREVVRIVIRNRFKNVKVSFWAQQIKSLQALNLRKKEPILLEDIKKKKNMFLDFTFQSTATKLQEQLDLFRKFQDLLPIPEKKDQPRNIVELNQIYLEEPSNNKVRYLKVYLSRLHDNRIIYRLCQHCKKKVQKYVDQCPDCQSINFYHKYNCQMEFADCTGSLNCVAFQYTAQKLFNKTAGEMSQMPSEQMIKLIEDCLFREYTIGIENKNLRLIVRSIEGIENEELVRQINQSISRTVKMMNIVK